MTIRKLPEIRALNRPRADGTWKTFQIGDRVNILNPHDPEHSTGTIQTISGETPYGVLIDGMESMGIHKWYTTDELELVGSGAGDGGDMPGTDDPEAKKKKKKHDGMKMSAARSRSDEPPASQNPFEHLSPVPPDHALARWKPGIHAAVEGSKNVISIYDVIGEDFWTGEGITSKRIAAALRSIGDQEVTVNVNSPGGDFFEGIAIYNLLREHPHKVTVKVMGLAASAASIIAMAGDEIQISEIGFLMVHNAWAVAVGNRHDMREAADTLEPFDDAMASLYAARAGVSKAEAAGWMDKETWFNGAQAIENGLADGLLPSSEIEERADNGAKSLAAARRIEAALRRADPKMSRSESKSLITDFRGGMTGSATTAMTGSGDISADLRRLIETLRS